MVSFGTDHRLQRLSTLSHKRPSQADQYAAWRQQQSMYNNQQWSLNGTAYGYAPAMFSPQQQHPNPPPPPATAFFCTTW